MNQLIWFTIPGAILMAAWAFIGFPVGLHNELIIVLALPIGFAIHQSFRTLFEWVWGWELSSRWFIDHLQKRYIDECEIAGRKTRRKAFIIWEMTLYSNKTEGYAAEIPESFRKHNRDSWHYLLSFWSCAFISFLCPFGIYVFVCVFDYDYKFDLGWTLLFFLIAIVFWIKGNLTYIAINEQEVAALRLYKDAFDRIAAGLDYPIRDAKNPVNRQSDIWDLFFGFLKNLFLGSLKT